MALTCRVEEPSTASQPGLTQRSKLHRYSITLSARTRKRRWDRQAESFGGRNIDEEFEVSRLHDRKFFRLGAAEDLDKQTRRLPIDRVKEEGRMRSDHPLPPFLAIHKSRAGPELQPAR